MLTKSRYSFPNRLNASQSQETVKRVLLHAIVERTISDRGVGESLAEGAAIYGLDIPPCITDDKIEKAFNDIRKAINIVEGVMVAREGDGSRWEPLKE